MNISIQSRLIETIQRVSWHCVSKGLRTWQSKDEIQTPFNSELLLDQVLQKYRATGGCRKES